jgi:hypothetical protein
VLEVSLPNPCTLLHLFNSSSFLCPSWSSLLCTFWMQPVELLVLPFRFLEQRIPGYHLLDRFLIVGYFQDVPISLSSPRVSQERNFQMLKLRLSSCFRNFPFLPSFTFVHHSPIANTCEPPLPSKIPDIQTIALIPLSALSLTQFVA